jgi:gamma-glutamyltranspeptidase
VAPGKRPFHTIIPAFLTKDGQPVMSYGVMGANMQPQGHLQTLVRMLDYHQNPQAACDAPRWRYNAGLEINVEQQMDKATVQGLAERGHRDGSHQRQLPGLWRGPVHLALRATPRCRATWPPAMRGATAWPRGSDSVAQKWLWHGPHRAGRRARLRQVQAQHLPHGGAFGR